MATPLSCTLPASCILSNFLVMTSPSSLSVLSHFVMSLYCVTLATSYKLAS